MKKLKELKKIISELNKLDWSENLDSIYQNLIELDYLLYRHKEKDEYIDKIINHITEFIYESDYFTKRQIFNLIKALCNILIKYKL